MKYIIVDRDTKTPLVERSGFDTDADARLQAEMDAKCANIKNYDIHVK